MAGLKELRTRIEAIKSTQKITSAMKMPLSHLQTLKWYLMRKATLWTGFFAMAIKHLQILKCILLKGLSAVPSGVCLRIWTANG